jgi:hypothetical protein
VILKAYHDAATSMSMTADVAEAVVVDVVGSATTMIGAITAVR